MRHPEIKFVELNWEQHRVFCKTIGVSALPLVKIYTSSGEVESFPCGPKKVEILRAKLVEWSVKTSLSSGNESTTQSQPSINSPTVKPFPAAGTERLASALCAALPGEPNAPSNATSVLMPSLSVNSLSRGDERYNYNVKADAAMKNGYYTSFLVKSDNLHNNVNGPEKSSIERNGALAVDLRRINHMTLLSICENLFGHIDKKLLVRLAL